MSQEIKEAVPVVAEVAEEKPVEAVEEHAPVEAKNGDVENGSAKPAVVLDEDKSSNATEDKVSTNTQGSSDESQKTNDTQKSNGTSSSDSQKTNGSSDSQKNSASSDDSQTILLSSDGEKEEDIPEATEKAVKRKSDIDVAVVDKKQKVESEESPEEASA